MQLRRGMGQQKVGERLSKGGRFRLRGGVAWSAWGLVARFVEG